MKFNKKILFTILILIFCLGTSFSSVFADDDDELIGLTINVSNYISNQSLIRVENQHGQSMTLEDIIDYFPGLDEPTIKGLKKETIRLNVSFQLEGTECAKYMPNKDFYSENIPKMLDVNYNAMSQGFRMKYFTEEFYNSLAQGFFEDAQRQIIEENFDEKQQLSDFLNLYDSIVDQLTNSNGEVDGPSMGGNVKGKLIFSFKDTKGNTHTNYIETNGWGGMDPLYCVTGISSMTTHDWYDDYQDVLGGSYKSGVAGEDMFQKLEHALSGMIRGLANFVYNIIMMGIKSIGGDTTSLITIDDLVFDTFGDTSLYAFYDSSNTTSLVGLFKDAVSQWFSNFQGLALVVYIILLLYVGLRILIAVGGRQQARYKEMLIAWGQGLLLLLLFPIAIKYAIQMNHALVTMIADSRQEALKEIGVALDDGNIEPNLPTVDDLTTENGEEIGNSMVSNPFKGYKNSNYMAFMACTAEESELIVDAVVYAVMVFQFIILLVAYYKRLMNFAFLVTVFPIVMIMYPIDKVGDGNAQSFSTWATELMMNIFMQVFHAIVYVFVIGVVYSAQQMQGTWLLAIVGVTFLFKGEELLRSILQPGEAQTAPTLKQNAGKTIAAITVMGTLTDKLTDNIGHAASSVRFLRKARAEKNYARALRGLNAAGGTQDGGDGTLDVTTGGTMPDGTINVTTPSNRTNMRARIAADKALSKVGLDSDKVLNAVNTLKGVKDNNNPEEIADALKTLQKAVGTNDPAVHKLFQGSGLSAKQVQKLSELQSQAMMMALSGDKSDGEYSKTLETINKHLEIQLSAIFPNLSTRDKKMFKQAMIVNMKDRDAFSLEGFTDPVFETFNKQFLRRNDGIVKEVDKARKRADGFLNVDSVVNPEVPGSVSVSTGVGPGGVAGAISGAMAASRTPRIPGGAVIPGTPGAAGTPGMTGGARMPRITGPGGGARAFASTGSEGRTGEQPRLFAVSKKPVAMSSYAKRQKELMQSEMDRTVYLNSAGERITKKEASRIQKSGGTVSTRVGMYYEKTKTWSQSAKSEFAESFAIAKEFSINNRGDNPEEIVRRENGGRASAGYRKTTYTLEQVNDAFEGLKALSEKSETSKGVDHILEKEFGVTAEEGLELFDEVVGASMTYTGPNATASTPDGVDRRQFRRVLSGAISENQPKTRVKKVVRKAVDKVKDYAEVEHEESDIEKVVKEVFDVEGFEQTAEPGQTQEEVDGATKSAKEAYKRVMTRVVTRDKERMIKSATGKKPSSTPTTEEAFEYYDDATAETSIAQVLYNDREEISDVEYARLMSNERREMLSTVMEDLQEGSMVEDSGYIGATLDDDGNYDTSEVFTINNMTAEEHEARAREYKRRFYEEATRATMTSSAAALGAVVGAPLGIGVGAEDSMLKEALVGAVGGASIGDFWAEKTYGPQGEKKKGESSGKSEVKIKIRNPYDGTITEVTLERTGFDANPLGVLGESYALERINEDVVYNISDLPRLLPESTRLNVHDKLADSARKRRKKIEEDEAKNRVNLYRNNLLSSKKDNKK